MYQATKSTNSRACTKYQNDTSNCDLRMHLIPFSAVFDWQFCYGNNVVSTKRVRSQIMNH